MRICTVLVAVGVSLCGVHQAEAVKITFRVPAPATQEAPPHPTLIVENALVARVQPTTHSGKALGFRVTPIDEYWSRVTVDARPGDDFYMLTADGGARYHVVARPSEAHRDVVGASSDVFNGTRYWQLDRAGADGRAWMRVDWAYDPKDIDRGVFGSRYESHKTVVRLPAAADAEQVFLRVTTFRIDGKIEVSRMWLTREGDDVTIHDGVGSAPARTQPRTCVVETPRPVPVDPVFHVSVIDTPRFRAITSDGRVLPTTPTVLAEHVGEWSLAVSAPEGTTFALERLPLPPGCAQARLLRATSDRSHDEPPNVLGPAPGGYSKYIVAATLEDADTWGEFDISTRDLTGPHGVMRQTAADLELTTFDENLLGRTFVTITPIWGTTRGAPWTGWVEKADGSLPTFEPAVVPPARRTAIVEQVVAEPAVVASTVSRGRRAPVRPVLVVVLLLGLIAVRPRMFAT